MKKLTIILTFMALLSGSVVFGQSRPVKASVTKDGTPIFKMEDVSITDKAPTRRQKRRALQSVPDS